MSKAIKALLAAGMLAGVAGCAAPASQQEQIIFIDPAPIVQESAFNKYN